MGKKKTVTVTVPQKTNRVEEWLLRISKRLDWLVTKAWFRLLTFVFLAIGVILFITLIVYINKDTSVPRFHNQNTVSRSCLNGGLFFVFVHGLMSAVLFRRSDQMLESKSADIVFMRLGHTLIMSLMIAYYFFFPWLFPGNHESTRDITGILVGSFLAFIGICTYPIYKLLKFLQTPTFRQRWATDKRRKD